MEEAERARPGRDAIPRSKMAPVHTLTLADDGRLLSVLSEERASLLTCKSTSHHLALVPLVADGRRTILLPRDDKDAPLQVGRSTMRHPNNCGIIDPRVSRRHITIFPWEGETYLKVSGRNNPITLFRRGCSPVVLEQHALSAVLPGDEIHLLTRACSSHELTFNRWTVDSCAYLVRTVEDVERSPHEYVYRQLVGRYSDTTDSELLGNGPHSSSGDLTCDSSMTSVSLPTVAVSAAAPIGEEDEDDVMRQDSLDV